MIYLKLCNLAHSFTIKTFLPGHHQPRLRPVFPVPTFVHFQLWRMQFWQINRVRHGQEIVGRVFSMYVHARIRISLTSNPSPHLLNSSNDCSFDCGREYLQCQACNARRHCVSCRKTISNGADDWDWNLQCVEGGVGCSRLEWNLGQGRCLRRGHCLIVLFWPLVTSAHADTQTP